MVHHADFGVVRISHAAVGGGLVAKKFDVFFCFCLFVRHDYE